MRSLHPYTRAIIFEEDPEGGGRSVLDIIQEDGVDANAQRRLRRRILRLHRLPLAAVLYEFYRDGQEFKRSDRSSRFKNEA